MWKKEELKPPPTLKSAIVVVYKDKKSATLIIKQLSINHYKNVCTYREQ
jgi:hypothetical protein